MTDFFTKDRLLKILIAVSIVTVSILGINALRELSSGLFSTIGIAARSVIIPFTIAFLLTFIINPLAHVIENKTPLNRTLSIILAIAIGILFIVIILSIAITFIVMQMTGIIMSLIDYLDNEAFQGFIDDMITVLVSYVDLTSFSATIENLETHGMTPELLLSWVSGLFVAVVNFASSVISVVFTIILTPVFMYYLIKDREKVFHGIADVFPLAMRKHIKPLGKRSDEVIRGYFIGHGIVMSFITVFFIITYSILAMFIPGFSIWHAILFALVMGIFSIIPYLGVWISMSMPIVMLLTLHVEATNPGWIFIVGIIMIFVLNIIEEILESTLVQPNVFSKQVRIHPLAVLSSFIFFGGIFGLVGFILAVPIAGTIKVSVHYFKTLEDNEKTSKAAKKKEG